MGKPYDDPDTLRELYLESDLTNKEIADRLGCSPKTLNRKLREHDIPRTKRSTSQADEIGEEKLRELYHGKGQSLRDIGNRYDVEASTVADWLDRFNIETRTATTDLSYVPLHHHPDGYVVWRRYEDGKQHSIRVHRLLAVAEWGFDDVIGKDVHHRNGIPWDNRVENLQLVSKRQHLEIHSDVVREKQREAIKELAVGETNPRAKLDAEQVREIRDRHEAGEKQKELANDYGVSTTTVRMIISGESWTHVT